MVRSVGAEGSDNCGTCNSEECDTCRTKFYVDGIKNPSNSMKEAEEAERLLVEGYRSIIPEYNEPFNYYVTFYTNDGKLYSRYYSHEKCKDVDVECVDNNPLYKEKLLECVLKLKKYNECTCTNKNDEDTCILFGCNDFSCYHEMRKGKRTERKIYM